VTEGVVIIPPTLVRSSRLANYRITNSRGENLGQTETFLIDLCYWKVPFIVASFGGIEGLTDKWYVIPFELVPFDTKKKRFLLGVSKSIIQKAPGVDKNIWGPKNIDLRWLSEICRYYNVVPYWEMVE
jgi:hypothetical protein